MPASVSTVVEFMSSFIMALISAAADDAAAAGIELAAAVAYSKLAAVVAGPDGRAGTAAEDEETTLLRGFAWDNSGSMNSPGFEFGPWGERAMCAFWVSRRTLEGKEGSFGMVRWRRAALMPERRSKRGRREVDFMLSKRKGCF